MIGANASSGYLRIATFLFLLALIPGLPSGAQERPRIRISVENYPGHVQTEAVRRFSEELERVLGDRFDVDFYDSGRLFRDRDVLQALSGGNVEIAVPGTWQIDRYERSVAVFLLPAFFGRSPEFVHRMSDGALGSEINRRMQQSLNAVVLGRWLDLGHAHLYFTNQSVDSHDELRGLRIRVAGGLGNELRIEKLGGEPVIVPWNDLPYFLERRRVDGVLTTHETVRSGELWAYGVDYSLEDYQYFAQYVPLMRRTFWNRLSAEDRSAVMAAWESIVNRQREHAARAQNEARAILQAQGIEIQRATDRDIEDTRRRLLRDQDEMARVLGVPPVVVRLLENQQ